MIRTKHKRVARTPQERTLTKRPLRKGKNWHSYLTAISPMEVIPDYETTDAIKQYLEDKQQENSPFTECRMVHFARVLILDELRPAMGDRAAEELKTKYLMFMADVDGDIPDFLDRLYDVDPEFVHNVWGRCLGYPEHEGPVFFRRYIKRCSFRPDLPFAAFKNSVEDIAKALEIQRELATFVGVHHRGSDSMQAEWRALMADLDSRSPPPVGQSRARAAYVDVSPDQPAEEESTSNEQEGMAGGGTP